MTGFRGTGRKLVVITGIDGKPVTIAFLWVMADGTIPPFDPEKAHYATSDYVANVAASADITLFGGDTCSARRLLRETHVWKQVMDLDGALAHKFLSPGITRELITSSYSLYNAQREIEI
jgi:hypothetical protein